MDIFIMEHFIVVAQITGIMAFVFSVVSLQAKSTKVINILKTISQILFSVQYFLLGAYTAMFMNMFASLRGFTYLHLESKKKSTLWAQIIFIFIFVLFGLLTWDGIIGIFAILGMVIQTIAYGSKKPSNIRMIDFFACFMWFTYNLYYHSVGGLLSDTFSAVSIVIGIIRLDIPEIKNKIKKNND